MPFAGDQHPVQAPVAGAGNPVFRDRVRPRRLDRSLDDPDPGCREHGAERRGELGVPVPDEELEAAGVVAEVHQEVGSLLGHPVLRGMSRDAGQVHAAGAVLDEEQHAQAAQEHGIGVKKSAARMVFAWASRNARQVNLDRVGAGPVPASLRIRHTAGGATV